MIVEYNNKKVEITHYECYHGEAFIHGAFYLDGPPLTDAELDELQELYQEELAEESASFAGMRCYDNSKHD